MLHSVIVKVYFSRFTDLLMPQALKLCVRDAVLASLKTTFPTNRPGYIRSSQGLSELIPVQETTRSEEGEATCQVASPDTLSLITFTMFLSC